MLTNDSKVINRLRFEQYTLECDERIWTFPRFSVSEAENGNCSFPDPQNFCIGIHLQPLSFDHSRRTLSRQEPSGRLSTVETLMEVPDEVDDGFDYHTTRAFMSNAIRNSCHKEYTDIDLNQDLRIGQHTAP